MKALLPLVCMILFASCSSTLHYTGTYTIKERQGSVTTFHEVKGKYLVESDTLKANDKIVINVIKAGRHH